MRDRGETLRAGLHLAVLWSFAIAKPLFDILADDPAFFVARDLSGADVAIFSVGLVVLPPLLLLGVERLADLLRGGLARPLHLMLIAVLASALAIQFVKEVAERPAALIILAALVLGSAFAVVYGRTEFAPSMLTVLSPAPLAFLALFLVASPVERIVLPDDPETAARSVGSDAPVVIVVFDELPLASLLDGRGRIDASRYPSFAELARRSTWYRNTTAVAAHTSRGLPAILAGDSELDAGVPVAGAYPENLFTVLSASHEMHVVEAATQLCPESICGERERDPFAERMTSLIGDLAVVEARRLLPPSLADELPAVNAGYVDFLGRAGVFADLANYGDLVEGIDGSPRTLHFFHLELPHAHWRFLPGGRHYPLLISNPDFESGATGILTTQWGAVGHLWQRHLLQLGFTDKLLGRLIGRLQQEGIWDRALVVAVADHGAAFEPGEPRRDPTDDNLEGIAPVPLFVKSPGQAREAVSDAPLCTNGVLHVIAVRLGVEPAPEPGSCPAEEVRVLASGVGVGVTERRQLRADLRALLRLQERLFGSHDGWRGVWRFGDVHGLVGRRVRDLAITATNGPSVRLETEDLPNGGGQVPSLLVAHLSEPLRRGDRVAIATGKRISAVGVTYELEGEMAIAAMLPPRAIARGTVRLFRIATASPPRLQELPVER